MGVTKIIGNAVLISDRVVIGNAV